MVFKKMILITGHTKVRGKLGPAPLGTRNWVPKSRQLGPEAQPNFEAQLSGVQLSWAQLSGARLSGDQFAKMMIRRIENIIRVIKVKILPRRMIMITVQMIYDRECDKNDKASNGV